MHKPLQNSISASFSQLLIFCTSDLCRRTACFPDHHGCGLDKRLLEHFREVAREARLEACEFLLDKKGGGGLIRSSYC